MTAPSDASARALAIAERRRNVLIDAGAGTGKTTILVGRLVELIAPQDDGPAMTLERVAAITFTRRAAGELRLRVRGRLLHELACVALTSVRRTRLRSALAAVDAAHIGTIHSFADRLLRMRPGAARLGPSYEVIDDRHALVAETSRLLLHGAARSSLAEHVGRRVDPVLVAEAERCISDALRLGLRPIRRETEFWIDHGLDSLVEGFVEHRDVETTTPPPWTPDVEPLRQALAELTEIGQHVHGDSPAARWLRRVGRRASEIDARDLGEVFSDVAAEIYERRRSSRKFKKAQDCDDDPDVWRAWRRIDPQAGKGPALGDDITVPMHRWMANRLLRTRPVVLALYESVKRRRGVLDEIDLLLLLRNLMRDDLESRGYYQRKFDHIFVDEFQDTDPLQSEILMYLGEAEPVARCVDDVVVGSGRITIVGDPLQSIYRFRRADVAAYAEVCERLASEALRVSLTVNFRSQRGLLAWANDGFRDIFGTGADGQRFDVDRGRVHHRDLDVGRGDDQDVSVHVLPVVGVSQVADACREAEAQALPRYLHWLVGRSGTAILDAATGERRPVDWGDICVLAMSTVHLPRLFAEMDTLAVPYSATGGTLFLQDSMQQRFILALRAISDPTDGPAAACLRRPPFFSVHLGELVRARVGAESVATVTDMEATIHELRRRRFERTPGETARALLEQTLIGASVAIGPNGVQRLARLRELCHLADMIAFEDTSDFDAVTARMRRWIDDPEAIDGPPPIITRAVRVSTIHQAKGLEFPVVVLWDARATAQVPMYPQAWQVSRDGGQWMIVLDGLRASHPSGADLAASEAMLLSEERRRLSYVAATRARDLLVIPRGGGPDDRLLWRGLSEQAARATVRELEPYVVGRGATWADGSAMPDVAEFVRDVDLHREVSAAWTTACSHAASVSAVPLAVTSRAHELPRTRSTTEADDQVALVPERGARHGSAFGIAVHQAIGLVLSERVDAAIAAASCACSAGVAERLITEVEHDVRHAIDSLAGLGVSGGAVVRLEYPVAGLDDDGTMLVGAIDLLAVRETELWIIDFKTDTPPAAAGGLSGDYVLSGYATQLRLYAGLLRRAGVGVGLSLRSALLFTGDGSVHEVSAT